MEDQARDLLTNGASDDAPRPGEILLRVKSANHPSCEDLEFYTKYSYSVKQIKETIQRLNSQHPEVKEQRLIYSGHLLDDNQVLKDVLTAKNGSQFMMHNPSNPNQAVTMHLACTSKYIYSSSSPSSSRVGTQKPNGAEGNPIGANGIPQQPNLYNNQSFPAAPNFEIPEAAVNGVPQDMLSLHQMYVEQMTAYMNQWYLYQGAMMGGMFYQMPQAPVGPNTFAVPPQAVPPQVFQQRNDAPPVVNQPQQDNIAAARAVVDDEENQRDLLDWMYTASRVLLVFSVVYFYSSFSRFLLVIVFTGLVIILQKRNTQANNQNANGPAARDAVHPQPPHQPPPERPQEPQDQNNVEAEPNQEGGLAGGLAGENEARRRNIGAGEAENAGNESESGRPDGSTEAPDAPEQNRVSYRELMWTFVTTFFTSLIPETYQNN